MTRRDASNYDFAVSIGGEEAAVISRTATAAAWVMKPTRLNLSSPFEASATPAEIMNTIMASFLLGSCNLNVQEIKRIATGVNACMRYVSGKASQH
jgi:hypothetical protein